MKLKTEKEKKLNEARDIDELGAEAERLRK
jgi:hypothetical protein